MSGPIWWHLDDHGKAMREALDSIDLGTPVIVSEIPDGEFMVTEVVREDDRVTMQVERFDWNDETPAQPGG